MRFKSSLKLKLIYVFRINDEAHDGCLKVGETTCDDDNVSELTPNSNALNEAARQRINQYTQTAGIAYDLLYTELALYDHGGESCSFNDKDVHNVLKRSGVEKKIFDTVNKANEWFITDLETVKRAIAAVKEGRQSLNTSEVTREYSPIVFRPEQQEAINKTKKQFRKGNQMLWNAKMRFGKTLSALQVVKDMEFQRTLILTHRPVVDAGWFEDFGKIFYDRKDFVYGSGNKKGESYNNLEQQAKSKGLHYIYFASIQDLRGSEQVGGNFDKNHEVFATDWDLIIVDEAHEGTQTELGKAVMGELVKNKTKVLRLSGTPFNLLDDFKEDEIYTWDYVMEQRAKMTWDELHFGDPNPYASLPTLNIYTYDLGRLLREFTDEDVAFNFREFFRVNESGCFCHEKDVLAFLNLLTKEDENSLYPYANEEYRNIFRHTLWKVPGVKEARALSAMLQTHPVFQHFKVVNVAGDGDEESRDALKAVEEAIGENPDATRTITLSCVRLTTGVSVKAWTAVFMLSGSYNTAASGYMQTIFRVQTPAIINGRMKEQCYVFDFAPDRTLKVIAETAKISAKAGKTSQSDREAMGEFINFCPIISIEGSKMNPFDVSRMLEQLKKVYVERVVRNGFEDNSLYNDELMKMDDLDLKAFDDLKKIIGQTKAMPKTNQVDINSQGLNNEEYEEKEKLEKKPRKELTEEERKRLEELKSKTKNREAAISILRGISIRMPLLIYGAEVSDENQEITIDNFASLIDSQSWEEFMPKGVTKQKFDKFKKYYDPEIFCAAGKRIRAMARAADKLSIEERIERITNIFSTFRNPDKETVLTPWRVVNMHLGDCLGGYNFYDAEYRNTIPEPRFIDKGEVTAEVFSPDARILEINSKSGLYPLYMAYGIYRARVKASLLAVETVEEQQAVWDKVIAENIFVICKTPMAKSITKRTLAGFREAKVNTRYFEDLINRIKNKPENFIAKVVKGRSYWKAIDNDNMKFNAIVGNPPYQVMDGGDCTSSTAVYQLFIEQSCAINPDYISMITPSRWLTKQGRGLSEEWASKMLLCNHFKFLKDYLQASDCFPGVEIKGGICYFLYEGNYNGECVYAISQNGKVSTISTFLGKWGMAIRDICADKILKKISDIEGITYYDATSFSILVNARHHFDQGAQLSTSWREFHVTKTNEYNIKCYLNKQLLSEGFGWVKLSDIPKNLQSINYHKIYISKAYGAGENFPHQIIGVPFYGEPNSVCTDTYIVIMPKGGFSSKAETMNVITYMRTKFFRYLVFILKKTQDAPRDVYKFVPLQDFTSNSDIDWSKSVVEIDRQLYAKYNLTDEEIAFVESMIKAM